MEKHSVQGGGVQKSERDVLTPSVSYGRAPLLTAVVTLALRQVSGTCLIPGAHGLSRCGTHVARFQKNLVPTRFVFPTIHILPTPKACSRRNTV